VDLGQPRVWLSPGCLDAAAALFELCFQLGV